MTAKPCPVCGFTALCRCPPALKALVQAAVKWNRAMEREGFGPESNEVPEGVDLQNAVRRFEAERRPR